APSGPAGPDAAVAAAGRDRMLVYARPNWTGDGGTWTQPSGFNQRQGGASLTNCEIADLVQASQGGSGNTHASSTASATVCSWLGALIGTTVSGGGAPSVPFQEARQAGVLRGPPGVRRGRQSTPVPAQVVVTAPAWPPPFRREQVRLLLARRHDTASPPPAPPDPGAGQTRRPRLKLP